MMSQRLCDSTETIGRRTKLNKTSNVDIRRLKIFAQKNLSGPLKEVLLVEHDELSALEF
jgi:hypothetical protein